MSIQSEINRISGNVADALDAIEDKGVTIPSGANSDDLADLIAQITGGGGGVGGITQDEDGYLVLSPDAPSPAPGGGLEYESGIFIPVNDIARPTINFSDVHTTRPYNVIIKDANGAITENSVLFWTVVSWYDAFDAPAYSVTDLPVYGGLRWAYGQPNGYAANGGNISAITGSSMQALDYSITPTAFYPYCNSSSFLFRAGRTYKWIAVWAPST